jgi:hypothetical protein
MYKSACVPSQVFLPIRHHYYIGSPIFAIVASDILIAAIFSPNAISL